MIVINHLSTACSLQIYVYFCDYHFSRFIMTSTRYCIDELRPRVSRNSLMQCMAGSGHQSLTSCIRRAQATSCARAKKHDKQLNSFNQSEFKCIYTFKHLSNLSAPLYIKLKKMIIVLSKL